jgi:K+-transporting ATPase ATPase A chain
MTLDVVGLLVTLALTGVGAWLLGGYMAAIVSGRNPPILRPLRALERTLYRLAGVDEEQEQTWIRYLVSMLVVTVVSVALGYVILRFQDQLPLNPAQPLSR